MAHESFRADIALKVQRFLASELGQGAKDLIAEFQPGSSFIFGGVLRDLAMDAYDPAKSDIDIVVDVSEEDLIAALADHDFIKNRFSGYRVFTSSCEIDIWPVRSTWAFSEGHIPFRSASDLLKTTFLTVDALLYDPAENRILCEEDVIEDMVGKRLSINLEANPRPRGSAFKILRAIKDWGFSPDEDCLAYLTHVHSDERYDFEGYCRSKSNVFPFAKDLDISSILRYHSSNPTMNCEHV